jgi:hypothetical protein
LLALVVAEGVLRVTGRWRLGDLPVKRTQQPTWHEPDPELGWWLRPGHYVYRRFREKGAEVEVTIGADRSRRTRVDVDGASAAARPELLALGCSFTFGQDVSDQETWPWRLQALRPDLDVRNRGTAAYGTLQALLLLERVLAQGERPRHVIYGFIPQQGVRNVGEPHWQLILANLARSPIALPYGTLDGDGRLVRHPPRTYPSWPLHRWLALPNFLEWKWLESSATTRQLQEAEVTRQLLQAMADVCRAHGIRFSLLMLLDDPPRAGQFAAMARGHGIEVIDCHRELTRDEVVGGIGHPNGRAQAAWGECVAAYLAAAR